MQGWSTTLFAAKRPSPQRFPISVAIKVQAKAAKGEFSGFERPAQLPMEAVGLCLRNLVLDRDVQPWPVRILSCQGAMEMICDMFTDHQHAGAFDCQRRAAS